MLNGVVYKLKCINPNITEFYIGSSVNIKKRIADHKTDCNNISIKNKKYNKKVYRFIRDNGGWDNWKFETLLEVEVESKEELRLKYERQYQLNLKPELNVKLEGRTKKEHYDDNKEKIYKKQKKYNEKHKEKIAKYKKIYNEDHKEEQSKYIKKWKEEHKEELAKRNKEWYEDNKEEIAKKSKVKIKCECGSNLRRDSMNKHLKSNKHKELLNKLIK